MKFGISGDSCKTDHKNITKRRQEKPAGDKEPASFLLSHFRSYIFCYLIIAAKDKSRRVQAKQTSFHNDAARETTICYSLRAAAAMTGPIVTGDGIGINEKPVLFFGAPQFLKGDHRTLRYFCGHCRGRRGGAANSSSSSSSRHR